MPFTCAQLKAEYEFLQRLINEYSVVYLRVRDSGDLTEVKQLRGQNSNLHQIEKFKNG